jgi:serine/threonine-protein kinase
MKTCPECQKNNSDDAAFCLDCGAPITNTSAEPARPGSRLQEGTVPRAPFSESLKARAVEPVAAPSPPAAKPAGLLPAGAIVDGKYRIERILGEGGMGVVYLAQDIHTQVAVVVKAIRTEYAHRKEFHDRILEEGRALAHIDHPNVVRLNAVVVEPDAMYLVMQFIEGEALDHRIERYVQARTPMATAEALRLFRMVLEGVAAAHREGVIHRDLKPANILLRARDGVAKVTDFGIAKGEEDAKAGRGQTRGIIGSLLYMAPEQISGRRDLDKRVDVYALGILLFELLVGRVPFDGPSEFAIMKLHLEGTIPRISQMRSDVPPFVDDMIQRACAKDRNDRFPSCDEFIDALDRGAAAVVAAARPAVVDHPVAPPTKRISPTGLGPDAQGRESAMAETAESDAIDEPPASEPRRGRGFLIGMLLSIVALIAVGAVGLSAAFFAGWIGPSPTARRPHVRTPPSSASGSTSTRPPTTIPSVVPDAATAVRPLAALVGAWKTDAGRVLDAVQSGDVLEFRIRDASEVAAQGYVDGESRFTLTALAGETRTFGVEDKIRPTPPDKYTYDPKARATCQEVWSALDKKPLRAQFDGNRLTVDLVKIVPSTRSFELDGNSVVGCKDLKKSTASKIEVILVRHP